MNSSFEQTIERLAIDADIRDLTARFSDAVNRRDFNAFGDLFADDDAWEIGNPSRAGPPVGRTSQRCSRTCGHPGISSSR
jgi:ketosteroid isomerase-like protein